jgi:hypothetical protein
MADLTVANTILEQLGGRRFVVMTGARDLVGDTRKLMFKIPRAKDGINHITIALEPSDTYTVTFQKYTFGRAGLKVKTISTHEDIYCDMLRDVFTRATGLYTSL